MVAVLGLFVAVMALARDYFGWSPDPPPVSGPVVPTAPQPNAPQATEPQATEPQAAEPQPPGPSTGSTSPPARITSRPPSTDRVLARELEQFALAPMRGLDLDTVPATPTSAGDERADIRTTSYSDVDPGPGVTLGDSTARRPTADDCRARLGVPGVPSFDPPPGEFICVRTTEGNLVLVQYLGLDDDATYGFVVSVPA